MAVFECDRVYGKRHCSGVSVAACFETESLSGNGLLIEIIITGGAC
jgi:hypothetical protein